MRRAINILLIVLIVLVLLAVPLTAETSKENIFLSDDYGIEAGEPCTFGNECTGGDICIAGTCRVGCSGYTGYGCSDDTLAWSSSFAGTCGVSLCIESDPIQMHCGEGVACVLGTDSVYTGCNTGGGFARACDTDAGGNFNQEGICGLESSGDDCVTSGFVVYCSSAYRAWNNHACAEGSECDDTLTVGRFSAGYQRYDPDDDYCDACSGGGNVGEDGDCDAACGASASCDEISPYTMIGGSGYCYDSSEDGCDYCSTSNPFVDADDGGTFGGSGDDCGCTGYDDDGYMCDEDADGTADGICGYDSGVDCIDGEICYDSGDGRYEPILDCGTEGDTCDSSVTTSGFSADGEVFFNGGTTLCCNGTETYVDSEASGNCCYDGAVLSHGSSSGSMICHDGLLYDCGGVSSPTSPEPSTIVNVCNQKGTKYCQESTNSWISLIPDSCGGCTTGNQCVSGLCVRNGGLGYCLTTCSSQAGNGCSIDDNAYSSPLAGTCLTAGACDTTNPVRANCGGGGSCAGADTYATCTGYLNLGDSCDSDAGGDFVQDGVCAEGASNDCATTGFVVSTGMGYYEWSGTCAECDEGENCDDNLTDGDVMTNGQYDPDDNVCDDCSSSDIGEDGDCEEACGALSSCDEQNPYGYIFGVGWCYSTDGCSAICVQEVVDENDNGVFSESSVESCGCSSNDDDEPKQCDNDYDQVGEGVCVYGNACDVGDVCYNSSTGTYYGSMTSCINNSACDSNIGSSGYVTNGLVCGSSCYVDGSRAENATCCHNDNCGVGTCQSGICSVSTCVDNDGDGMGAIGTDLKDCTSTIYGDCDDGDANILPPYDGMSITSDTLLCNGTYYVNDSSNDGLMVFGAGNQELRCNDTFIIGDQTGYGIYSNNRDNLNITGCVMRNYSAGIYLLNGDGLNIFNVTSTDNDNYGILLYDFDNSSVFNVTVEDNGLDGVYLYGSDDSNVFNVTARNHTNAGVYLSGTQNSTVYDIDSNGNYYGILDYNSTDSTIYEIYVNYSGMYGMYIYNSDNSWLYDIASDASYYGLRIRNSTGMSINDSVFENSTLHGVYSDNSSAMNISEVVVAGNLQSGVHLEDSPNSDLDNIGAWNNGIHGLFVDPSENVTITGVNISNSTYGIYCKESQYLNITYALISDTGYAVYLESSPYADMFSVMSDRSNYTFFFNDTNGSVLRNSTSYNTIYGIYLDSLSSDNQIYHNKFENSSTLHAYAGISGNHFNTSVGGVAQGNRWDDILTLDIFDVTPFDGFGELGDDYPYNSSNGAKVSSYVNDYGPMDTLLCYDADGDGAYNTSSSPGCPGYRDCDDSDANVLPPKDDLNITNNTVICSGTYYINDSGSDGVLLFGDDDVSVICNYTVFVGNDTGYGVYVNGHDSVNITGCDFTDYWEGVYLYESHNSNVWNISAWSNYRGVYAGSSENFSIWGASADDGAYGIYVIDSDGANMTGLQVNDTTYGLYVSDSNNASVSDILAWDNALIGVRMWNCDGSDVWNVSAWENDWGIYSRLGSFTDIWDVSVWDNDEEGLYVYSSYHDIWNVRSWNNGDDGIEVNYADYSNLWNISSWDNADWGIYLYNSDSVNVTNSTMDNNDRGLALRDSSDCVVRNNTIKNNADYGLYIYEFSGSADDNQFYWNRFSNNSNAHVDASASADNHWNTSVGGIAQGNYWDDVITLEIYDNQSSGDPGYYWGDYGDEYPYSAVNGANVNGADIIDYGPMGPFQLPPNCTIINSSLTGTIANQTPYHSNPCYIFNSTAVSSSITSAVVINSTINTTTLIDSQIFNSSLSNSYVEFSTIINTTFCGAFGVFSAGILNGYLQTGRITFNSTEYFAPATLAQICAEYVPPYDPTAPTAPTMVYDGTGADIDWFNTDDSLSAWWEGATEDVSTIYYRYLIVINGTYPYDNNSNYTDVGTSTSIELTGLDLDEGNNYSVVVVAYNAYGLNSSNTSSDGATLDITAPGAPTIYSTSHPDPSQSYISGSFFGFWNSTDPVSSSVSSGILGYSYLLDQDSGASPDSILESRYQRTLMALNNDGYLQVLRENVSATDRTFTVVQEVRGGVEINQTLYVEVALMENLSEVADVNEIEIYAIDTGSIPTQFDLKSRNISTIETLSEDIRYVSDSTQIYTYSTELTVTEAETDSIYIVVSGVYSDDDNTHNLSIAGTMTGVVNSTYSFLCQRGVPGCIENNATIDYGIGVKTSNFNETYEVQYDDLADGMYWFHAKAQDLAGNIGPVSHFNFTVFFEELGVILLQPISGQVFTDYQINVTVRTSENSSVRIVVEHPDGSEYESLNMSVNGTQTFTGVELETGTNKVYAEAIPMDENITAQSEPIYVIYSPKISVSNKTLRVTYSESGDASNIPHLVYRSTASYLLGFATENPGAGGAGSPLELTSDTEFYSTKIFATTPDADEDSIYEKLEEDILLDQLVPVLGWDKLPTSYIIATHLRYPNIYISGFDRLPSGKYGIRLINYGLTEDGRKNVTLVVT